MSIILDENAYAERMIAVHDVGKRPFHTICMVARYYLDKGMKPKQVRKLIDEFLLRSYPCVSLPKWASSCDRAITLASQRPAVKVDCVRITQPELEKIKSLDGIQCQRLAFALLCLAKYWLAVNPKANGWVNNKDSEIMAMANIRTSVKRQSGFYNTLNAAGLIKYAKRVDNTNVQVCFAEDGEVVIEVDDFRNLGYQYNQLIGQTGYVKCQVCGVITPKRGRTQKYCPDCAKDVWHQQMSDNKQQKKYSA